MIGDPPEGPEETRARAALYARLAAIGQSFSPARTAIIVMEPGNAHVQVEVPGTTDPAEIYLAGQKALFALATFLERYEAEAAQSAGHRKAQSS